MRRKQIVSQKEIDTKYWRNVDIQDQFWRRTFTQFVPPLQKMFRDPVSAGAHLLSAYMTDAEDSAAKFVSNPAEFGQLNGAVSTVTARALFEELLQGRRGLALEACAQQFAEQRVASADIEKFAAQYPKLYWELQKERSARREGQKPTIAVQFFGKSVDVDKTARPKIKRKPGRKFTPPNGS